jgi:hypothetical protein
MLRRGPLFAFVAISAIALAVGINAGFFTLIDAFMLEPLPVANPGRLMKLLATDARHYDTIRFSYSDLRTIAAHSTSLEGLVGYYAASIALRIATVHHASAGSAACVSGNYFISLGGHAAVGRLLLPADDDAGAASVAVISDALWTRAFARAPDVVGRSVVVDGTGVTVVGVAGPDFRGINPLVPDLWMSFRAGARAGITPGELLDPANRFIVLHARLRPNFTLSRASAELSALVAEPPAPSGSAAELTRRIGAWLMPNEQRSRLPGRRSSSPRRASSSSSLSSSSPAPIWAICSSPVGLPVTARSQCDWPSAPRAAASSASSSPRACSSPPSAPCSACCSPTGRSRR